MSDAEIKLTEDLSRHIIGMLSAIERTFGPAVPRAVAVALARKWLAQPPGQIYVTVTTLEVSQPGS